MEQKCVHNRMYDSSLVEHDLGHKIIVVQRQGSVIVYEQGWPVIRNFFQPYDLVAVPKPALEVE